MLTPTGNCVTRRIRSIDVKSLVRNKKPALRWLFVFEALSS
jgi:hypothetical protein